MFQLEREQKKVWLKAHYPSMKDYIWVPFEGNKEDALLAYIESNGISCEEAVFIDDVVQNLIHVERYGIRCYHNSSLFDWEDL